MSAILTDGRHRHPESMHHDEREEERDKNKEEGNEKLERHREIMEVLNVEEYKGRDLRG